MTTEAGSPQDPGDPRAMSGAAWDDLCDTLRRAGRLALGEGVPDAPRDRAAGLRYLTRFLAAGIAVCVEHADADQPEFGRMIEHTRKWGLDAPDCLYLYATVRGDAEYRIAGERGSANHLDVQVNYGHFASGDIGAWGTIASTNGLEMEIGPGGGFELFLGGAQRPGNWLPLAPNAEFVLVRQYFDDWDAERPAELWIERLGQALPAPALRSDEISRRLARLCEWLEKGGALWEQMSRGLLSMEPNTLIVHLPENADKRAGMGGQAYGMGNFHCAPDEAVIVEFTPPRCHHWSVSLANYFWESIDYATRQSSLNRSQARLDPQGVFRAVIAHRDPGVANWLDPAGNARGTIAARFLLAESAPKPVLRRVALGELSAALPADTPLIDPASRATILERRRRAVCRRDRR